MRAQSSLFFLSFSAFLLINAKTAHLHGQPLAFVFRRIPPLENELGSSPTLARVLGKPDYYFDPLSLGKDDNFAKYREAELKHGRVAMLATIGMLVAPLATGDSSQTAVRIIQSLRPSQYIQVLATCAFLEAFVFVQQDSRDMPGDYQTGYFGVRDKGRNERSMISELENGRLAMLAFVVQIVLELVTKKSIVVQWQDILGPFPSSLDLSSVAGNS